MDGRMDVRHITSLNDHLSEENAEMAIFFKWSGMNAAIAVYSDCKKVGARLREPAGWLPLAAGASSRNLESTFLTIHLCLFVRQGHPIPLDC